MIIKESFFDRSIVDDVVADNVGYSWTVSDVVVDEDVLVERESEREEYRGCFEGTDFGVEVDGNAEPFDG